MGSPGKGTYFYHHYKQYRCVGLPYFKGEQFRLSARSNNGAVAMSSGNGLVGTGFASQYRLNTERGFKGPMGMATTPSSLSLTSNRVATDY